MRIVRQWLLGLAAEIDEIEVCSEEGMQNGVNVGLMASDDAIGEQIDAGNDEYALVKHQSSQQFLLPFLPEDAIEVRDVVHQQLH